MEQRKFMSVKKFRQLGLLHELNRQFLHPLGLAIEVEIDPQTGDEKFGRIWDCTSDPEGIIFGKLNTEKMDKAKEFIDARHNSREARLGYIIQTEDKIKSKEQK